VRPAYSSPLDSRVAHLVSTQLCSRADRGRFIAYYLTFDLTVLARVAYSEELTVNAANLERPEAFTAIKNSQLLPGMVWTAVVGHSFGKFVIAQTTQESR